MCHGNVRPWFWPWKAITIDADGPRFLGFGGAMDLVRGGAVTREGALLFDNSLRFAGKAARLALSITLAGALMAVPVAAIAQEGGGGINLLRDTETEKFLRQVSEPLWIAAGLDPTAIHVYLVGDPEINAFVAEGQNLFMQTGTIVAADVPNQLIGVIAHETGHIADGHISRTAESIGNIERPMLIGMLLGFGAMLAGSPQAGAAILAGSQTIGERSFLAFTRTQEASADQAAVKFLTATHQSGQGLLDFFEKLRNEEIMTARRIDPYAQSHPLSAERITLLQQEVDASPYKDAKDSPELVAELRLIQAKITGFMDTSDAVFRRYPLSDTSAPARYARAAAYYHIGQLKEGLEQIDSLIQEQPKDPYFYELKGQMLFESGKVVEAVDPYKTAVQLMPHDGIIHTGLAQALIGAAEAQHDPKLLDQAIPVLQTAIKEDAELPMAWRFLAEAYADKNDEPMADLATAEFHYETGNIMEAGRFALRARDKLEKGTVSYNRALDIIHLAQDANSKHRRQ